jgi:hypothetical protein
LTLAKNKTKRYSSLGNQSDCLFVVKWGKEQGRNMNINLAHIRAQAASGGPIDFAVFDARSTNGSDTANSQLLAQLTARAKASGLKVDQSALAYSENGRIRFFGSKHLVDHLSKIGLPRWTHTISV